MWKDIVKLVSVPVAIASLCCLSPVILVLMGVASVSFAGSLADTFYGEYKWGFRLAGLLALVFALLLYFRKKGVCTLDQARRRKNEIINTIVIVLFVAILGYIVFLYGVVEVIGLWLGLW